VTNGRGEKGEGATFSEDDVFVEGGGEFKAFWGFLPRVVVDCATE